MRAFAFEELGGPGSIVEVPIPDPAEGQVRIRVAAAGLNPFDNAVVQGYLKDQMEHRFPLIPSADASGTVEALGDGVTDLSIGDEVFGSVGKMYLGEGTFAEFATMSTATIARKPGSVDHPDAAAIPVAGGTALTMVDTVPSPTVTSWWRSGRRAGSGATSCSSPRSAARGSSPICSATNAGYARTLGAAEVIDYAAGDVVDAVRALAPDGVDVVAEMHRGEDGARLAELVRSGGRFVSAVGGADEDALKARGVLGREHHGSGRDRADGDAGRHARTRGDREPGDPHVPVGGCGGRVHAGGIRSHARQDRRRPVARGGG